MRKRVEGERERERERERLITQGTERGGKEAVSEKERDYTRY